MCADWGGTAAKRAVWEALVAERVVRRVEPTPWTFAAVLTYATRPGERVLAAFDAPLGLPASYLVAARATPTWASATGFRDWLRLAPETTFDVVRVPAEWSLERPFFRVPAGRGSLTSFVDAARAHGVELRRAIDRKTSAKSGFIVSGIPGSVGSAGRDLWRGIRDAERDGAAFGIWPFDGVDLLACITPGRPLLGEMYPRAAYATALSLEPPAHRARLRVAKTKPEVRRAAIARLLGAPWVRERSVTLSNVDAARTSEDDFDAMIAAAALLRCVLDHEPLHPAALHEPGTEGGILGTGSIDLDAGESTFVVS